MTDNLPESFSCLHVPFVAKRLKGGTVVWLSEEMIAAAQQDEAVARAQFIDRFGYMIPGGVTFDELEFDLASSREMMAERYGGSGIGVNGGGARCGNLDGYQIKGNGQNLLAGLGPDVGHSYGGFKALYAVYEAISSAVLNMISPVGVAEVHGVFLTGPTAAYHGGENRAWGGVMVREIVLRPAHFLRASNFVPMKSVFSVASDVGRVRAANKQIFNHVGGRGGCVNLLATFLRNSANQFAFARMARVMHGAVSPSNICLDGRWIDLTNTTFLGAAENLGGGNRMSPSFYEELNAPLKIGRELANSLSKFNGINLNFEPLVGYYQSCLSLSLRYHLTFVLGLDPARYELSEVADQQVLTDFVVKILSNAPTTYDRWPTELKFDDPVLLLIDVLYRDFNRIERCSATLERLYGQSAGDAARLSHAFRRLIFSTVEKDQGIDNHSGMCGHVVKAFVIAMRRTMFSAFYYKGRVEENIGMLLDGNRINELEDFIYECIESAEWVFDYDGDDIVIVRSDNVDIHFACAENRIFIRNKISNIEKKYALDGKDGVIAALWETPIRCCGVDIRNHVTHIVNGILDIYDSFGGEHANITQR